MKSKEVRTIKSTKNNQRSSLTDLNQTNYKQTPLSYDQACLQIQIKIPKGKNKLTKQNKHQKVQTLVQDKINRKKQKKKVNHEFNKTLLVSESIENKQSKKDLKETSKLKSRTADKTFRNPSRADTIKKSTKEAWLSDLYFKNTFTEAQASNRKKEELTKQIHLKLPKQQYLFLGDEFYLVNNYCPTKRLLNTFREACIQDKNSKFVAQDRYEKGKGKIQLKRNNIFMAARKEIQMKSKIGKAIIIQKWWKDILRRRNIHNLKSNPQNVGNNVFKNQINVIDSQQITVYDCHQRKTSFQLPDCISQHQRQYHQDQQIVSSFNSVQMMGEPKKIEFKAQDLNQKLMEPYKLPQQEVSSHQNQAIFQSYTRFRMQESNNNESDQQQSLNNSPIHSVQNQQNQAIREESQQISFDLLKQFKEATRIKELIDVRIAFQKGQIKHGDTNTTKIQISTSILAIHNFLVNFFNYYIQKYREEFISMINMPFGFSLFSRLRCIHGESLPEQIQEDDEGILYGVKQIIEGDKLDQFYRFLEFRENKGNNTFVKTNFELQKIHHRAVLDLFNEELNQYRPYRLINGVPYPWNHSYKALTFYFVTEENIAEVFQKVQLKILKNASLLCGIILPETSIPLPKQNNVGQSQEFDIAWFIDSYRQNYHGLTLEHNEGREVKLIHEQIKQQVFEYDFQLYTKVMFELSQTIFEELIRQNKFLNLLIFTAVPINIPDYPTIIKNIISICLNNNYTSFLSPIIMSNSLPAQFYSYILFKQNQQQSNHSAQITVNRVSCILQKIIAEEYQEAIFTTDYFKDALKEVSNILITIVYRRNMQHANVGNLVAFVSLVQYLLHSQNAKLPKQMLNKLHRYTCSLVVVQNIQNLRIFYEDSKNSTLHTNFYQNIFIPAYLHRSKTISSKLGIILHSTELPTYLMKLVIQQSEGNLQNYNSILTPDCITLSMIYYLIAVKYQTFKKKPILSAILKRYNSLDRQYQTFKVIIGDELCHFYNQIILTAINKLQAGSLQHLIDDIDVDPDIVDNLVVLPIQSQNNTVLDNIIFSSSMEP